MVCLLLLSSLVLKQHKLKQGCELGEGSETTKNMLCPVLRVRDTVITFLNKEMHVVPWLAIAAGMGNEWQGRVLNKESSVPLLLSLSPVRLTQLDFGQLLSLR